MSLHEIQTKVHVAKDKWNKFGEYGYRTAEGILSALKAALPEGWSVVVSDEIGECAGQIFVTAEARISDGTNVIASAKGHAMHPLQKKGMDPSQITGAASSYARKYALAGLLALDDGSVDPDRTNKHDDDTPTTGGATVQAWRDGIDDSLPENATNKQKGAAYADAMVREMADKSTPKSIGTKNDALENYINARSKIVEWLEGHLPEKHGEVIDAYLARKNALLEEKAEMEGNMMRAAE